MEIKEGGKMCVLWFVIVQLPHVNFDVHKSIQIWQHGQGT